MTSYTNCDIEINMGPVLSGMPTDGLDVDATERTAREMVQDALMDAFPQYSVDVHVEANTYGVIRSITREPRDIEDSEEFEELVWSVVDGVLESDAWYVLSDDTNPARYEVDVIADEPWTDGVREGVARGVLDFVESSLTLDEFAQDEPLWTACDAQLRAYCSTDTYLGYGMDGHTDADMFVFADEAAAAKLARLIRHHVEGQASVTVSRLA